jgi:hypothetical protein
LEEQGENGLESRETGKASREFTRFTNFFESAHTTPASVSRLVLSSEKRSIMVRRDSLAEIKKLVEEGRPALVDTVQTTRSLRSSHPKLGVPRSIYSTDDREDGTDPVEAPISIWSEHEFDFDDIVVNSRAYRQALAAARAGKQSAHQPAIVGDLIDFSDAATITPQVDQQPEVDSAAEYLKDLMLPQDSFVIPEAKWNIPVKSMPYPITYRQRPFCAAAQDSQKWRGSLTPTFNLGPAMPI